MESTNVWYSELIRRSCGQKDLNRLNEMRLGMKWNAIKKSLRVIFWTRRAGCSEQIPWHTITVSDKNLLHYRVYSTRWKINLLLPVCLLAFLLFCVPLRLCSVSLTSTERTAITARCSCRTPRWTSLRNTRWWSRRPKLNPWCSPRAWTSPESQWTEWTPSTRERTVCCLLEQVHTGWRDGANYR